MSKQHLQKNLKPRDKAALCLLENDIDAAEEWLEKALEEDENDHAALGMLADICMLRGEFQEAIGLLVLAIAQKPDEKAYLFCFVLCASKLSFSFTQFNAGMANAVQACLAQREIANAPLWRLWLALLLCHPDFSKLGSSDISYDSKEKAALAAHPYFLSGLQKLIVFDMDFERRLTALRLALFRDLSAVSPLWERTDFLRIAAALSRYCFYTEYIFDATPEEESWVATMRQSLSQDPSGSRAEEVALFSCYECLGVFSDSSSLIGVCEAEPLLADVADLQIRDNVRLLEIKKTISAITPINDEVSEKVQEQYEIYPYPRWQFLPADAVLAQAEKEVPKNGNILNAGCGTGYEAALVGTLFPNANILAIDLSKSSLSYAVARAQDLGLSQIKFAQADILQMGSRKERYDYILSSGVLHHMADPFAGWKVLRDLLKPSGLMRIALYSEKARNDIVTAREAIRQNGFAATREHMKEFRRRADEVLPLEALETLRKRQDYYQMSMICDLLFHVQEHRFDLLQLASMLKKLRLEFISFNLTPDVLNRFHDMHGELSNSQDLTQWHALEEAYPDTFTSMYHFWCRAKD
jgi:2-polyprenyl-3-methyl-5-hydroxy-6-metoxy-1,4-benzoquinol methylase